MKFDKELEGRVTIFANNDSVKLEITDEKSNIRFLTIEMDPSTFCGAIGRQGYMPCKLGIKGLENVGKTHEWKEFVFSIPKEIANSSHKDELKKLCNAILDEGWVCNDTFSSQNTFYTKGDGTNMARCVVRRWI